MRAVTYAAVVVLAAQSLALVVWLARLAPALLSPDMAIAAGLLASLAALLAACAILLARGRGHAIATLGSAFTALAAGLTDVLVSGRWFDSGSPPEPLWTLADHMPHPDLALSMAVGSLVVIVLLLCGAGAAPRKTIAITQAANAAGGESWQAKLRASLADPSVSEARPSPGRYIVLPALGIVVMVLLNLLFGAANYFVFMQPRIDGTYADGTVFRAIWLAVTFLVFQPALIVIWDSLTRARARSALHELASPSLSRRPVLYLRAFEMDKVLRRRSGLALLFAPRFAQTAEQKVVRLLSRVGPTIAIGRPGERLPQLGAARFYVADEHWRQKVIDAATVSGLVVWMTGESDGLRWELDHLVRNVAPERLIVWPHPQQFGLRWSRNARQAAWENFRSTLGRAFPQPLPERLGDIRFITFDRARGWQPIPYEGDGDTEALARLLDSKLDAPRT